MHSDELSYALWRTEQSRGLVLKPNLQSAAQYEKQGREKSIEKLPSVIDTTKSGTQPQELMAGIETPSGSKAFRWTTLLSARLIQDRVGTQPVVLIVGPDNLSFRSFQIPANSTFLRRGTSEPGEMIDAETSSVWNLAGCATEGPLRGRCLDPIEAKKDYWFDWQNYHSATTVFTPAVPSLAFDFCQR